MSNVRYLFHVEVCGEIFRQVLVLLSLSIVCVRVFDRIEIIMHIFAQIYMVQTSSGATKLAYSNMRAL